ncbi:TPA: hypothetical protein ACGN81_006233 [Bacillus cereus]
MIKFSYKKENNKTEIQIICKNEMIISTLFGSSTLIELIKYFLSK